jgi:hypothetical protein
MFKRLAYDEAHVPHISILHRFVAAKDLPEIDAIVAESSKLLVLLYPFGLMGLCFPLEL